MYRWYNEDRERESDIIEVVSLTHMIRILVQLAWPMQLPTFTASGQKPCQLPIWRTK